MDNPRNLPTIDNAEFRKENAKKFTEAITKTGGFFREGIKTQKPIRWYFYIAIFLLVIMIILIGVEYVYTINNMEGNFLDNFYGTSVKFQKYVCSNSIENATFNTPKNALEFKELFPNATCNYYSIKK